MKAMRLFKPDLIENNPLTLVDVALPEPAAGQVRLRVRVCGVCHTDLHIAEGDIHPPHLPVTPGHQVVGVVDALGAGVQGLKIGARVGVPWLYSTDRTCAFCRRGEENLCPNARFTGFHTDGGFAEYMLAQADFVLSLPEAIPDEQAAPLLCAGIIGYRSLRRASLQPGERLGLFGFGASAHLAIQVAHYWGCEVFVFTRSPEHRQHALQLGAAWTGGLDDNLPALLDRAVTFAPAGPVVPRALEKLRPGGTLAINAVSMTPIPEMSYDLIYGERTLCSVANATYQDGLEFLKLAVEAGLHSTVNRYALADANLALTHVKHSRINGEAVLIL
jgi:propanol-preferring alcohol dehydrogenase